MRQSLRCQKKTGFVSHYVIVDDKSGTEMKEPDHTDEYGNIGLRVNFHRVEERTILQMEERKRDRKRRKERNKKKEKKQKNEDKKKERKKNHKMERKTEVDF